MKYWYYLKAVFNHDICFECGHQEFERYYGDYLDGRGILLEAGFRCKSCKAHHLAYAYGSYDDPLFYMETKWQRFKYLFFGIL